LIENLAGFKSCKPAKSAGLAYLAVETMYQCKMFNKMVLGNNQPKMAVEEMAAETATVMVTLMMTARAMTVAMATAMMVGCLPDRQ
jgi:hypothetical protein